MFGTKGFLCAAAKVEPIRLSERAAEATAFQAVEPSLLGHTKHGSEEDISKRGNGRYQRWKNQRRSWFSAISNQVLGFAFTFWIGSLFVLMIALPSVLLAALYIIQQYSSPEISGPIFVMTVLIFLLPMFVCSIGFNYRLSPFQENRTLVADFTGGGTLWYLIQGSSPFFRLMVYEDALEVRFIFHRFLIPFDRMDDLPNKLGFFSPVSIVISGFLIKSDLPGVPSRIRFNKGFQTIKVLQRVNETRNAYLNGPFCRPNSGVWSR
jgi:hypothetical protein